MYAGFLIAVREAMMDFSEVMLTSLPELAKWWSSQLLAFFMGGFSDLLDIVSFPLLKCVLGQTSGDVVRLKCLITQGHKWII